MNGLINFLTTEEMLVVYGLIAVASVLYFVVYIYDKTSAKRKMRQNTRELRKIALEDDVKEEEVVSEPVLVPIEEKKEEVSATDSLVLEPILEPVSEVKIDDNQLEVNKVEVPKEEKVEEQREVVVESPIVQEVVEEKAPVVEEVSSDGELQYTSIEPNQSEAQAELMRLTETLEKAEEEVKNIDLTAFEEEQEQNAIISLDELMTRGKAMYESGELDKLEDEGNEPISLQDLEERMKQSRDVVQEVKVEEPEQMKLDDFVSAPTTENVQVVSPVTTNNNELYEHKTFKSSPVISPVFGIEKPVTREESDITLENTANYEKLDEEIRKTNEFLMTLKEFQKKLD